MFFERPDAGRRAVLLNLRLRGDKQRNAVAPGTAVALDDAASLEKGEFEELVTSAAIEPVAMVDGRFGRPHPRWFVGVGKLREIASVMQAEESDLLIANHELTPAQQRNLEKELACRVMTRTELILHIFADRARTHEGQLQVELAQLNHAQTRLVRGWTHLDRQRGGLRMRGAGEKQIELDARMVSDRIRRLQGRLKRVHKQRAASRRHRTRSGVPTVALVGYTNAGKSTLFNALTLAQVDAEDRMFATLDPTMRRLEIKGSGDVVLTDTVGFIRDLPVSLVDAFRATLEEVAEADLLLHVIDASADDAEDKRRHVLDVLHEIGAADVPALEVLNKLDLIGERPILASAAGIARVAVSALDGTGFETLRTAIAVALGGQSRPMTVLLAPDAGKLRARLYALGAVLAETVQEDGTLALSVRLDRRGVAEVEGQGAFIQYGAPASLT